jgi:hypothetical protein
MPLQLQEVDLAKGAKHSFKVQSFREKGKGLEADPPQSANDEAHALRKVERIAQGKAGAVAIRQDGNPALAEFEQPVLLKVIGRVPEAFLDLLPF